MLSVKVIPDDKAPHRTNISLFSSANDDNSVDEVQNTSSISTHYRNSLISRFTLRMIALIYVAVMTVTIFAMFIPIFMQFEGIRNVADVGIFGDTLKTSTRLKIIEGISIGCTLPMLSDNFLNKITDKDTTMNLSMWHRLLFLAIAICSISSVLYLSFSDNYFMPYLYILLNHTKVLLVGAVTSYAVLEGTILKSLLSKSMFFAPFLIAATRAVFQVYSLVFPEYTVLHTVTVVLLYPSLLSFFWVQFSWYFLLWRRYRTNKSLNNEEKKECVYMLAMLFYIVACQVVAAIFNWPESWLDTGENILIGYIVVQIVCILLATVLPTWFMRKVVQVSEAVLQLKKEFVRFVSHEIRSPLNVVHAGLELLQADLAAAGSISPVRTLLQDIYFASNAVIDILNDMVQFEHIDSGDFRLDCVTAPMLQAFAGKLNSFNFLLSQKNQVLKVEDLAQVSEFYTPEEAETLRAGLELHHAIHSASSSAHPSTYFPSSSLFLFMDKIRVEQIIRNLILNAMKFSPEGGKVTVRFLICPEDPHQQQLLRLEALSPETVAGFSSDVLSTTKSFLRIEVQDSGPGVAVENQPKMLQQVTSFNRSTLQGGSGGSGLSLWICKNLAAIHGGRMGFKSDGPGRGSTFFVDLPIYSAKEGSIAALVDASPVQMQVDSPASLLDSHISIDSRGEKVDDDDIGGDSNAKSSAVYAFRMSQATLAASSLVEEGPSAAPGPTRVLIVDDSSMNRKIIRRMLESAVNIASLGEVSVEEADDGTSALEAMQTAVRGGGSSSGSAEDGGDGSQEGGQVDLEVGRGGIRQARPNPAFDLILIDYVMTSLNGPEAVKIMRKNMKFSGGIIGVTGNALPSDLTYFEQCGVDMVITKPLTNKKLIDAILTLKHKTKN